MTTISRILMVSVLISFAGIQSLRGQTKEERLQEKLVMKMVASFLERAHISGQPLGDTTSKRAFKAYVESLDPIKVYFYKSDIDEFARHSADLDDMLKEGEPGFALAVFKRFLERINERVETVEKLLAGDFDFTLDEEFITDGDSARYPTSKEEAHERWRRRIKYDLLSLKSGKVSEKDAKERLLKRYRRFRERVGKEKRDEVLSRFVNALAMSFDPHTVYMGPKSFEDFEMGLTLNYQGIGALLGEEDGAVIVRRILPGRKPSPKAPPGQPRSMAATR